MKTPAMIFALGCVLSLAAHAADNETHVDCANKAAAVSTMTPEQKAHFHADCVRRQELMACNESNMDMTAEQRQQLKAQCQKLQEAHGHQSDPSGDATNAKGGGGS